MKRILVIVILVLVSLRGAFTSIPSAYADTGSAKVTVIMYHSILNSRSSRYIVSDKALDDDLKALKEDGYNFISQKDLIGHVDGSVTLPNKPLLITFDDGNYNNMYYGLKILEKYNAPALFSIVGAYSQFSTSSGDHSNPNYSHLTWQQISELSKNPLIEISNHTYNLHKTAPRLGIDKLSTETEAEYADLISKDITRLNKILYEVTGVTPIGFAYPFGRYTKTSHIILQSLGFKVMYTCNEGVNKISRYDYNRLFFVRRINREGHYSTQQFLDVIHKYDSKVI